MMSKLDPYFEGSENKFSLNKRLSSDSSILCLSEQVDRRTELVS